MDLIGFGGFRSPEDDPPKPWRRWVRFLGTTGLPVGLHIERGDTIRIISTRKATKKEREQYEENAKRLRHA